MARSLGKFDFRVQTSGSLGNGDCGQSYTARQHRNFIKYQFADAVRDIYLDDPGPSSVDSWMGWSVGHWEGDTLVVDVTGQNNRTWLDRAGSHHSEQIHVVERYTLLGPNHIQYEATIEDPVVLTEPFTIRLPLYRRIEDNARILDFKCVEFVEELLFGEWRRNPLPR